MKKRVLIIVVVAMYLLGIGNISTEVQAEELGEDLDYSYLMTEDALIGYADMQTWGVYLVSGNSAINKISSTKIGAGGMTNASTACRVAITSIVERQTSTGWVRVTSWNQTNENALSAVVSKSLTVAKGYYYRVRSSHYAATDVSSSWTDALWMGN